MRSLNRVILVGNLGKPAETKFTAAGTAKTTFSVATNRRWKDQQSGEWKDVTDWHNVVLWRSENVANFLVKGCAVAIEGRLETRSWEQDGQKKFMTEVVADEVILLGGREQSEDRPVSAPRSSRPAAPARNDGYSGMEIDESDIPF